MGLGEQSLHKVVVTLPMLSTLFYPAGQRKGAKEQRKRGLEVTNCKIIRNTQ